MKRQPLVSAIALCYNHSAFVVQCLESIRAQTYPNIELIIMDDCSTDDSVAIIENWISRQGIDCTFVVHRQNQGLCRTLNEAIRLAHGEYISLIATDDTWLPGKLSRQVAMMESAADSVGVVYSDAYQINDHGERLPDMFMDGYRRFLAVPEGDLKERLVVGNFIPAMTTLIRRTVYERVGYYDELLLFEDWDFWLRVAEHFTFAFSPYPSANYRILPTSMARTMLGQASARSDETYARINRKILAMQGLSESARTLAAVRLVSYAVRLFNNEHAAAASALIWAFLATKKVDLLLMATLASVGVRAKSYWRVTSYLGWRLSRLRPRRPVSDKKG
jgi:glycosyltransferase involved in cell wall biosynthesis